MIKKIFFAIKPAIFLASFMVFNPHSGHGQYSSQTEVSVLTCSPGPYLYASFGHTAVRVMDPESGYDVVYNFGTFDFDTPNFYVKFARGRLNYALSKEYFKNFQRKYKRNRIIVYQQVLSLDSLEKVNFVNALEENYKPKNRYYKYDFFRDNCTSRVRDLLFDKSNSDLFYQSTDTSYRQAIDPYLARSPWTDFGIDLLLGLPSDKVMDYYEAMFLPYNLMEMIDELSESNLPLIKRKEIVVDVEPVVYEPPFFKPWMGTSILFLIVLGFSWKEIKNEYKRVIMDKIIFGFTGFLGLFMLLMWFATDHYATQANLNILWALPNHLVLPFVLSKEKKWFISAHYAFTLMLLIIVLLFWNVIPQGFHPAAIPLILILLLRVLIYLKTYSRKIIAVRRS
mgnify:CR=1 FL=1